MHLVLNVMLLTFLVLCIDSGRVRPRRGRRGRGRGRGGGESGGAEV